MQICCWNLAKVLKHQTAQFYSVRMLPILVVGILKFSLWTPAVV